MKQKQMERIVRKIILFSCLFQPALLLILSRQWFEIEWYTLYNYSWYIFRDNYTKTFEFGDLHRNRFSIFFDKL